MHGIVNLMHAFVCSVCNAISYTTQVSVKTVCVSVCEVRYIRIHQEALRKLSHGKVAVKVKPILAHFGRCALPATTVKQTLAKCQ